ncbi:MAG TPA: Type 1 glutamine amidotransferase-like domain-containing protein [Actinomycetota bacterium]|nr:Type 1 glutamine amidotransferase-like domain-containing protein [Actinomycetota bacterium]
MDDPLAYSRIGLVGSGEFTPSMVDVDRDLLASIGPSPRVVILPTASAGENPEEWATWGVGHFLRLGARSIALMVLGRSDAEDEENVEVIERADLVYISGGKPARLLAALQGSPLWGGFLRARREGAWLMGSSAGAMALGDWTLVHRPEDGDGTPTQWLPGLGMLQGMAVVPHFDAWDEAEYLTAQIAGSCRVFGIDEDTAVLLERGKAKVAGRGAARFIRGGHWTIMLPGQELDLIEAMAEQ